MATGRAVVTGSHLDSVPGGGAFDGPLGIATAFAAIDELERRGLRSRGAGRHRGLRRGGGRPVRGAVRSAPGCRPVPSNRTGPVRCVTRTASPGTEAMRDRLRRPRPAGSRACAPGPDRGVPGVAHRARPALVHTGNAIGVASRVCARTGVGGWTCAGRPITPVLRRLTDRHDPMLAFASDGAGSPTGGDPLRRAGDGGQGCCVDAGRNQCDPVRVNAWLDARAEETEVVRALWPKWPSTRAARRPPTSSRRRSRRSPSRPTSSCTPDWPIRLASPLGGAPLLPTGAGHDAGILAAAGVPSAMLYVRNPTGVSHSPAEHAEAADCHAGVDALADVSSGRQPRPGAMTYWCEHAVAARRGRGRRLCRGRGRAFASVTPSAVAPPGHACCAGSPCRAWPTRTRTRSTARCGTHPRRRRGLLVLARGDVRGRRPAGPGLLPRAGARDLRRDGPGRHHLRRGVPLPAPRARAATPYADPNAMGAAVAQAAREAGIRITVLDTCYLAGGFDRHQRTDASLSCGSPTATSEAGWAGLPLRPGPGAQASAPPCTRCARSRPGTSSWSPSGPPGARCCMRTSPSSRPRTRPAWPRTGARPTALLHGAGALASNFTAVHGTHLTGADIELYGLNRASCASAPPPNGTSPTASARPRRCARPGRALARQRQPRGDRPVRGGPRPSSSTSG